MSATTLKTLSRDAMAARIAADIPEGWVVNLGIGAPTLVANHVPPEREVIFHSENGILGVGPAPEPGQVNPWLINAGKQHVTLRDGAAIVGHADSFEIQTHLLQNIDGHALAQFDQSEQKVFGAEKIVVKPVGFFPRESQHLLRARSEVAHGFVAHICNNAMT